MVSLERLGQILVSSLDLDRSSMPVNYLPLLLHECLWGNKVDLSFNPQGIKFEDLHTCLKASENKILINDTQEFVAYASNLKGTTVHFVVDNVGSDVLSDLCLASFLTYFGDTRVFFHVKENPIFVSDVTLEDWEAVVSTQSTGGTSR
eukprot:TRINITY_DN11159_c0_g1_i3.p1 TRINITY_DN11159_c0_g1~~TRINITY_DN11159_c0_g1_i3.p1  ORF type:complete len:148 (+),score=37.88 TRINITY_DN11159_c0_g1_i3:393-836(+)